MRERIWTCKIGGVVGALPPGADAPMRRAVEKAYFDLTGFHNEFDFSGWGGELDPGEREVVSHVNGEPKMNEEAQKAKAYASDKIGRDFERPNNAAVYQALETLRDDKYRIEWLEKEVERLRVKSDAFDALLSITKTGQQYDHGSGATSGNSTYRIERTIEDLEYHLRKPDYTGATPGHAVNEAEDLPSSFYEGVEAAQDEDVPEVPRPSFFHGVDVATGDDQTVIVEMFRISAEDAQKMQDHMNKTMSKAAEAFSQKTKVVDADEVLLFPDGKVQFTDNETGVTYYATVSDSDGDDGA